MITYTQNSIIIQNPKEEIWYYLRRYMADSGYKSKDVCYINIPQQESARAQAGAAYIYYDMMGAGEHEPDPIEMTMFVETVWDLPPYWTNKEMEAHLEGLARELDRSYGVDLWWTFNPTLRFEI